MTNPLMNLIASGEGGYNSFNRGTRKDESGKYIVIPANQKVDLAATTIDEIQRRQRLGVTDPDRMFAVGRYQFIPKTLDDGIVKLDLDTTRAFDSELQDRLFNEYLLPRKRPNISDYIEGRPGASLHDAQKATCKEWASVEDPDTPGHVYAPYEALGNKMHTTSAQVAVVLDEMRAEYQARIDQGMPPREAWVATTTMGPGENAAILDALSPGRSMHGFSKAADHGQRVTDLQAGLRQLGYADPQGRPLTVDGHMGPATRHAVESFQRDHGLEADGVAGRHTLAALDAATTRSIGQPDAAYLREQGRDDGLAVYRDFAPEAVPRFPVSPVVDVPTFPSAAPSLPDGDRVRNLQEDLNTLGLTDHRGQPLPVTGEYDDRTRHAVMGFQMDQGMTANGLPDAATLALVDARATIAGLQHVAKPSPTRRFDMASHASAIEAPVREATGFANELTTGDPSLGARTRGPKPFSDPSHPQHALYQDLKSMLPEQTSDMRLAQFTSACHRGGIKAGGIDAVQIVGQRAVFAGTLAGYADVDLALKPTIEQSARQVQSFDDAQAQERMDHVQQRSQAGPAMSLPM